MKILDQHIPVRRNLAASFRRNGHWWFLLLATIVMDYLTTNAFVSAHGIGAEANLTTRFMMGHLGPEFGNLAGKALQLTAVVCLVGLSRRLGNFFLLFVVLINTWAVVMNSIS